MSTKRGRDIKAKVAALRELRRTVAPWGLPWCAGTGPHHQGPGCEGCAGRKYLAEELAQIDAEIARLLDPRPVLSGEVYALDGDQYALVLTGGER